MISEDEARKLLHEAAGTITVSPTAPGPAPRPTWRTPLLAAAAVLLLIGGIGVATWQLRDQDEPAEPSGPPVRVPSVFGYGGPDAERMLEEAGFSVRTEEGDEAGCEVEGRAVKVDPAPGTRVPQGSTVTLTVAVRLHPHCAHSQGRVPAWQFVDFANERGKAPDFADEVTLVVDGGEPLTISGAEAARRQGWGTPSALGLLRAATGKDRANSTTVESTLVTTVGTPPTEACAGSRPPVVGDREAVAIRIELLVDGQFACPTVIHLYRTGGRIDAVVAWSPVPLAAASAGREVGPLPTTEGLPLAEARRRITEAGYTVRVEYVDACKPRDVVILQSPRGKRAGDVRRSVTLTVERRNRTKDCAALDEAATDLVAFARGGAPPAFAGTVRLMLGYRTEVQLDAGAAEDPARWEVCPAQGAKDCPRSALAAIADAAATATGDDGWPAFRRCDPLDLGALPLSLDPADATSIWPKPVPARCNDTWAVQLWVDTQGRITAVNLLPSLS